MAQRDRSAILVVEDDADVSSAYLEILKLEGYEALSANSVPDAIRKLKNQSYDCIILDLKLGEGAGGEQLVAEVRTRADLNNRDTPILIASGNLSREILHALAGRIQGAIVKPVRLEVFLAQVQKLIL